MSKPADADLSFDLARARRETPGCEGVLHFNNAGAALPPACVTEAVKAHLDREAETGGYEAAEEAEARAGALYDLGGRLLHCRPGEIAYCHGATHGWLLAFEGLFASGQLGPGRVVLTGRAEYGGNILAFARAAQRRGVTIEVVEDAGDGAICLADLERRLRPAVGLIALTHVPTNGGLINPAAEVGRLARQSGTPYLLDACQSAGQMPLDVTELGCDMLTLTGRKYLRGPRGGGLFYVAADFRDRLEPLMFDMRGAQPCGGAGENTGDIAGAPAYRFRPDAKRYELWESNIALRLGLAAALDYALSWDMNAAEARINALAARLRDGLATLPGLVVHDKGTRRCGIVGFSHPAPAAGELKAALRARRVNISVSAPEMTWYDAEVRRLPPLARASVHYYNSEAEVDRFVEWVGELTATAD